MRTQYFFSMLFAFALSQSSCGSNLDRSIGSVRPLLPATGSGGGSGDCKLVAPSVSESNSGVTAVNINALQLEENGEYTSICRIMRRNGYKSAVIQFAGVTCLSCQDEAIYYNDVLPEYADQGVGHILALTDRKRDYPESMFSYFMSAYAKNAVRVHDQNAQDIPVLWRYFSKNPQMPNRPTIVSVNIEGKGYVLNDHSIALSVAADRALELAGVVADINPGSEEPIIEGPIVSPDPEPAPPQALPPLQLPRQKNIGLNRGYGGQVSTLASQFDSEYLIVDVSQLYCIYCTELADEHQRNAAFQSAMATSRCSSVTVIPDKDYSPWMQRYPNGTYVGNTTYSTSTPLWQVVQQLGIQGFRGTPTIMLLNRQGQIVAQNAGKPPKEIKQICGY